MRKNHISKSQEDWNNLVDELDQNKIPYKFSRLACSATIETRSYIYEVSLTKDLKVTYNNGAIISSFRAKTHYDEIQGQYGYTAKKLSLDKVHVSWDYGIASGYAYSNDYFARKWLKCWSYDINSAFAYAMLSPMPDTTQKPRLDDEVREGEIGFYKLGGATTKVGDPADIIFPLMDSPFKDYVQYYYSLKQNAADKTERGKWKDFLNIPTGHLAKTNVFLRNAILYYSNKYIKSFIDEDTVYCNVDCIVSLRPRYDLPIGDGLGQFKEEHVCDNFKYIKAMQYQWNKECHYNGIPGEALTDIEHTEDWQDHLYYRIKGHKIYENKKKNK